MGSQTEYDEGPQFHLISIRKTHDGAINLSQKSKDESILAYEIPAVDFRVYPSNNYISKKVLRKYKKKGTYRSSTVLRIRFFSDT